MITDHRSMSDLAPSAQAQKALHHVLLQIRERGEVGWYLGHGTETFALLTEAYATHVGADVKAVREQFAPRAPIDPRAPAKAAAEDDGEPKPETLIGADDTNLLRELAKHHGEQVHAFAAVAATTGGQTAYGFLQRSELHSQWEDRLETLIATRGAR